MKAMKLVPALSLLIPALAYAQPEAQDTGGFDHAVAPVSNAFEIGVAAGYAQGGGKLGDNVGSHLEDVAGPGGTVELDLGYRIIPELSVGAYGTFSQFQRGDRVVGDGNILGAAAGVQAAWHFRPDRSVDPWVSLGGGWKGLWIDQDNAKTTSLQGVDLARLQIGADYRVSKDVSISPVIGGSLGMFISQDTPMTTDLTEIQGKQVNFTGFAGVSGRFDLGGDR
jgi:outer membrane protein W